MPVFIIQAICLENSENLVAFCQGLQKGAPVDSYVTPEPWDMPGYDNQVMLVQVRFEQGAVAAAHTHFHTQSSFVLSGRFKVTIDGESCELKAGDGFYMEPNSLHEAVCLEPGVILDCFSPMREEFV